MSCYSFRHNADQRRIRILHKCKIMHLKIVVDIKKKKWRRFSLIHVMKEYRQKQYENKDGIFAPSSTGAQVAKCHLNICFEKNLTNDQNELQSPKKLIAI